MLKTFLLTFTVLAVIAHILGFIVAYWIWFAAAAAVLIILVIIGANCSDDKKDAAKPAVQHNDKNQSQ